MCGIVAYHGDESAVEKVFEGLKRLEYRGYDSAGIATVGNPSLKVKKGVGTIDEVVESDELDGFQGIGHTRWATHGGVNQENAHPHLDCEERVAVVHNGIINNHQELKQDLEGHRFESETDTEVIPHLFEEEIENGNEPLEAARNVMDRLEGSFAVVAAFETGEIVLMRQESPLVMGISDDGIFAASDVTPFMEHTSDAVFLENGDVAVIEEDYEIYNNGEKVEREQKEIDWEAQEATKEGYSHFMEKEIQEQPKTVKRAAFQDRSDMMEAVEMVEEAEDIYFTACGTAGIAASLGSKYLRNADVDSKEELAHEMEHRTDEIGENDLIIAVSQSGETADLLSVLRDVDADVLAIVNVVGSTLARISDHTLYVNAGPEIGVASTKAFTAQVAVLKLLEYAIRNELEEGRDSLLETADKLENVLENNSQVVDEISDYLTKKDDAYFIGRHKGYEMAREAALKLKELSYIHAEAFPGGEFKHGTLALVEDGTPVISFLKNEGMDEILSNTVEAKGRGADIIAVGTERPEHGIEHFVKVPEDPNREILEIVPFQLIAYLTAIKLGNNPDKPRNLAKSVTVK